MPAFLVGYLSAWRDIYTYDWELSLWILKLGIMASKYHVRHVHFTSIWDFNTVFCHVVDLLYPRAITTEVVEDIPVILPALGLRVACL